MHTTHTQTVHRTRNSDPYSVMLVLLLLGMVVGCTPPTDNHSNQLPEDMTTHTALFCDVEISFSLPRDYFLAPRSLVDSLRFYQSDVARDTMDPMYISSYDPRSHLSIRTLEKRENFADIRLLDSIFDMCIKEQFLSDKNSPQMPLLEKHRDRDGYPYAYIMYITRYNRSDTLWRNYPDTFICPTGADSVECSFYYYTLHGRTEYIIHYYSLESFEGFSFSNKRAVLESINISIPVGGIK